MTIRTNINPLEGTATTEKLVIRQVPTIKYQLVEVPGSTTDWSFMKRVRRPYTAMEEVHTWVVVEVRKATEKEMDEAMDEFLSCILD